VASSGPTSARSSWPKPLTPFLLWMFTTTRSNTFWNPTRSPGLVASNSTASTSSTILDLRASSRSQIWFHFIKMQSFFLQCSFPELLCLRRNWVSLFQTINLAAICTPADYNTRPLDTIYSNFIDALPVVRVTFTFSNSLLVSVCGSWN